MNKMATNGKAANGTKKAPTVNLEKRATAEQIIKKIGGGRVYLRKLKEIRRERKSTPTVSGVKEKVKA